MTEIGDDDVRRMVRQVRPRWEVRDWERTEEGTDFVAFLSCATPDGDREVVLKACSFLDPPRFRPEPRILELVAERTDVPVPEVVAVNEARDDGDFEDQTERVIDRPYFLMERLDGEQIGDSDDLAPGALDRLAHEAGHNLAAIHDVGDWNGFGAVRCQEETAIDGLGGLGLDDARDTWRARLREHANTHLDMVNDRFADLEESLREAIDDRMEAVPERPPSVLLHSDYRYGNLLVDPDSGETRAVLDWGNHVTGDPAMDVLETTNHLSDWAPPGSDRRERVREAILSGYRERRSFEPDPDRREAYLLISWLGPLAWFDLWYGDGNEEEMAADEARHRTAVETLL